MVRAEPIARFVRLTRDAWAARQTAGWAGLSLMVWLWLRGERGQFAHGTMRMADAYPLPSDAPTALPHPRTRHARYAHHILFSERISRQHDLSAFVVVPGRLDDRRRVTFAVPPGTLARLAPDADVIYTDYDHLDTRGRRHTPRYLPAPSPERLFAHNDMGGPLLVRAALAARLGDAVYNRFRLSEAAGRVVRVPGVRYHLPHGTAHRTDPDAVVAALTRLGVQRPSLTVTDGVTRVRWHTERPVSVVIPNKDAPGHLAACLRGLFDQTDYTHLQVVVVDNNSTDPATLALYRAHRARLTVVSYDGAFNFSRACNLGARAATGELLLFMNNDVAPLAPSWLARMAQWFDVPGVAVVGPKLLYPDGRVQHAGIALGLHGLASHWFRGAPESTDTPIGHDDAYRNVSAVTGACLMTSRATFEQVGGWDEAYTLLYSDVQFCLDVRAAGGRVVYTPDARLTHHEGVSAHVPDGNADARLFSHRWGGTIRAGDPYWNPNLSALSGVPALRKGPYDTAAHHHQTWQRANISQVIPKKRGKGWDKQG